MVMLPPDYRERVYAGWLGKCIGVRLGVPVENWTADEIARNLGEVRGFLPISPGKLFQPDDDTAFPLILARALEEHGPDVTPAQIGEAVLNGLADGRGTLWWGGYGRSTEHTAYMNLAGGIDAPASGSIALNGAWLAEQIGGQIFSDIWGLVAPNNPALAADLAARASSVTHDGAGVDGGRFVAGLVSRAFAVSDPVKLVEAGLGLVAEGGAYAQVVGAVLDHYQREPSDWRSCYRMLAAEFGPDRYGGPVHIIPNAGVVALALLYGAGDFGRSICIATMAGWDTDCNAGNVGAIAGVAAGLEGIGQEWRAPVNDLLIAAGVLGSRNLTDIPRCADWFSRLGARLAGASEQERPPRYHFGYPGTTHGFQSEGERAPVLELRQVAGERAEKRGALQISLRGLNKKGECRVFVPTYVRPAVLSANNYQASFSPTLWPGQTIQARLYLPPDAPAGLLVAPFAWDDNAEHQHQATATELAPGEWREISYQVPPLHNALLSRAGLVFRTLGPAWGGRALLDWLDWSGAAEWSSDFGRDRAEYDAASGWTFLRGFWRLDRGAYHGSGVGLSESYTGDLDWRDLQLTIDLVPLAGDGHHVLLRVQGARRSYVVGLAGSGRLALYKNAGGYREVAAAPFYWEHGRRVRLAVTATGNELTVAADGQPLLRWRDHDAPYLHGQIGVGNGPGCHTRFERVAVRSAH
jgi:ADP-ribosylglycohydrolase